LVKLNFHKNANDEFHCPVTFKVFNENTVIAAIKTTGNVFSYDAIEELNIKANYFRDLLNDEPFTRKDIIKLQDPLDLTKFNMQTFHHTKMNLKWDDAVSAVDEERKKDPNFYLRMLNSETKQTLDELNKAFPANVKKSVAISSDESKADVVNSATYSTGRVAASLTSTVMEIHTRQEAAKLDENDVRWARVIKKGKKGYVCLVTNFGRINIELFCNEVPRTCENFLKHCLQKYYNNTKFHRLVKNFMVCRLL
jgi:peptidyl-prolyl cis-trans isomerase-like protein 2